MHLSGQSPVPQNWIADESAEPGKVSWGNVCFQIPPKFSVIPDQDGCRRAGAVFCSTASDCAPQKDINVQRSRLKETEIGFCTHSAVLSNLPTRCTDLHSQFDYRCCQTFGQTSD